MKWLDSLGMPQADLRHRGTSDQSREYRNVNHVDACLASVKGEEMDWQF